MALRVLLWGLRIAAIPICWIWIGTADDAAVVCRYLPVACTVCTPMKPFVLDLAHLREDLETAYRALAQTMAHDRRQIHALHRAITWTRIMVHIPVDWHDQTILIPSGTRWGHVYVVGESCQCEAFQRGIPCWHRAVWLLVRRALDSSAQRRRTIAERGMRDQSDDSSD